MCSDAATYISDLMSQVHHYDYFVWHQLTELGYWRSDRIHVSVVFCLRLIEGYVLRIDTI